MLQMKCWITVCWALECIMFHHRDKDSRTPFKFGGLITTLFHNKLNPKTNNNNVLENGTEVGQWTFNRVTDILTKQTNQQRSPFRI